jgi:hypothetical protein
MHELSAQRRKGVQMAGPGKAEDSKTPGHQAIRLFDDLGFVRW